MRLLKLPWLNHDEENRKHEVYSLSVSPDGTRLASGGLDGKVRIWSIADILKYKDETLVRDEHCRPVCSMARHNGAVTVVKFSPDGRFLASGSDDKVLLIWERDEELRPSFGEQNSEHWTVTKRVVAHDNDIQDMAWAPDSSILVTVGLDRSVCIWNGSTFEKLKRFDVHQSTVKGVVFDPANKYFATSSDDRSVRIFRYHKGTEVSFSIEKTVLTPFKKSPLTTYFRRLSWSPDGQHIAVSNATNGPVTSVAIINRGSWDSDFSLIGHETPCEVASFSPILYEIRKDGEESILTSVVATGGQDKNLVVWNTAYPNPIVIFEEMTYKTITDIAWTPNGSTLFCSSLDGTISAVYFEPGELGDPVSAERTNELLNKYGVDKDSVVFPESTKQLVLEDKAAEFQKTLSENHMDRLFNMEQRPPQRAPVPPVKPATPTINILQPRSKAKSAPNPSISSGSALPVQAKLNKVVTTNGKKRVAPTLISTSSHSVTQEKFKNITVTKAVKDTEQKQLSEKLSITSYDLPKFGVQTSVNGYYLKKTSLEDQEAGEGDEIDEYDYSDNETTTPMKKRKTRKNDQPIIQLQTPYDDNTIIARTLSSGKESSLLEVLNYYDYEDEDDEAMTIIRGYKNSTKIFETYIDDRIIGITGSFDKYWVLATNSGSILIYSPAGRILFPRIELCYTVSYMIIKNSRYLLCVTEDFLVHAYDLQFFKKLHKSASLAPVLNYEQPVTEKKIYLKSLITDIELLNDTVYVSLENKESYLFDRELRSWVKVFDNYYQEFNNFDLVWNDSFGYPKLKEKGDSEESELIDFVRELTFLESYELVLKRTGHVDYSTVTKKLNEFKKDSRYLQVRSN